MQYFKDLALPEPLLQALREMAFERPTPIQSKAIPPALESRDLIGCAQTGTGKTAAFGIPTIVRLLDQPQKTALILVPTRELAAQVDEVLGKLLARTPQLSKVVLIGGVSMQPQLRALHKRPRIVIATPGRLIDHLQRRSISLASVDMLVLDEADRMLDMGFAPQLDKILAHLPKQRQTMLFSATMPKEIEKLAMRFLRNPERVTIGVVSKPVERIDQSVVQTTPQKKNELLLDELNARQGSVLVFARTQVRTDRVARFLASYGHSVTRLHGGRTQGQRKTAVESFKQGTARILVATDIAARGIDIAGIGHVINYDLPMVAEDYVHRIGRTARAGASGNALSFVTPEERSQWRAIQKLIATH